MNEKNRTILVVDDNEAGLYSTSRMLSQAGFAVKQAATGAEALRIAAEKPDLVVLDVHLPDINGLEVCKRIKADPATETIPVLHLSATCIDKNARVNGLDSGADAYLVHPVAADELVATVNALLRMKRAEELAKEAVRERDSTIKQLEAALKEIKTLSSLLPICQHCKKIRDKDGDWQPFEVYLHKHTTTEVSHGICEDCLKKYYPEWLNKMNADEAVGKSGDPGDAK